jgi:hypothetical protein
MFEKFKAGNVLGIIKILEISKDIKHHAICECIICGKTKLIRFDYIENTKCCTRKKCWTNKNGRYMDLKKKDKRFYSIWGGMNNRCINPKYKNYHGKGIIVCDRWNWKNGQDSFKNFYDDMYNLYLDHCIEFGVINTTIERIDSNKNYEFGNCKWTTKAEQARNTSRIKKFKAISPNGNVIIVNDGMSKFCRENNLPADHLIRECLNGKKKDYKGWIFEKLE